MNTASGNTPPFQPQPIPRVKQEKLKTVNAAPILQFQPTKRNPDIPVDTKPLNPAKMMSSFTSMPKGYSVVWEQKNGITEKKSKKGRV